MAENLLPKLSSSQTLARVFSELSRVQTPALIWHAAAGERIELSGRVLMNWVDKSANLLINECEIEEGSTLCLKAPLHWRSVAIALAGLRAGSGLSDEQPQVMAVYETEALQAEADLPEFLLLVDRGPLAMRYTGDMSALGELGDSEVLDFCALVRGEADQFTGLPPQADTELITGLSYADFLSRVLERARQIAAQEPRVNDGHKALAIAIQAPEGFTSTAAAVNIVREVLASLIAGYTVFIVDTAAGFDAEYLHRVYASERVVRL